MSRQNRSYSHIPENTRQFILDNDRLAIVMVGLPARGKSFMAKKIYKYLCHLQLDTKVFNFGSYRRIATKNTTVGKASAAFFDPDNKEALRIREQCCLDALRDLISWYNTGGQIGILDATNTTLARRKLIRDFFNAKRSELEYNVALLHVESICNDPNVIHNNIISVKLKNPDYCTVDAKKALEDFKERIQMYKKVYHEVTKEEGSYIKVIDVGTEVHGHQINHYISCRIFYFLMHLHLHSLTKTPRRPLLMQIKNYHKAKADKEEEERLKKISEGVGATFTRPTYDRPVHALPSFMRRPSYLMWSTAEDTYKKDKKDKDKTEKTDVPQPLNLHHQNSNPRNVPRLMANNIAAIGEEKSQDNLEFEFQTGNYPLINATTANPIPLGPSRTTPTPSPNMAIANPHPSVTPQTPKHSVRKSHVLHRLISSRIGLPKIKMAKQESDSVDDAGYHTDNESSSHSDHLGVDDDTDYKTSEMDTEDDDDEEFDCEVCGRKVLKGNTHLVENRRDSKDKVRICEICLYETDSEDDDFEGSDMQFNMPPALGSPAVPRCTSPRTAPPGHGTTPYGFDHVNTMNALRLKTDEIAMSIGLLVDELNETNKPRKSKEKHVKQELIRLKRQMEQLLNR